jgi:hypothetical protein
MRSTDFGQTWVDHYFVDDSTNFQYNPSVTIIPGWDRFYCVWEDGRNDATLGTDIYIGFTDDCLYWWGASNLLNTTQNIDEYAPSISSAGTSAAVAYLHQHNGSTHADLRLHVIGYSGILDMALRETSGTQYCTSPSLQMVLNSGYQFFYLVSYGLYDSSTLELKSRTQCFTDRNGWDLLNDIFTIEEAVGSAPSLAAAKTYPGVACQSVAGGNAIEHYIVRKTFEDGCELYSSEYYGKMDILWYISDGNDQY